MGRDKQKSRATKNIFYVSNFQDAKILHKELTDKWEINSSGEYNKLTTFDCIRRKWEKQKYNA